MYMRLFEFIQYCAKFDTGPRNDRDRSRVHADSDVRTDRDRDCGSEIKCICQCMMSSNASRSAATIALKHVLAVCWYVRRRLQRCLIRMIVVGVVVDGVAAVCDTSHSANCT
jgi:hypothetical protein